MKTNIYLILLLTLFSCDSEKKSQTDNSSLQRNKILKSITSKGQSGDVILKNGYGLVSKSIVKILNEEIPLSHCGILIKDTINNNFYIVHSVARQVSDIDGVQKIELSKFLNDVKPQDLYLLRYKTDSVAKIKAEALCLLNSKIPFDHKYNLYNDDELYCSEFIYKIFFQYFF